MALAATCVAQTYTNFGTVTSNDGLSGEELGKMWAVDVNNDGIPDLIQERFYAGGATSVPAQFAVSIANGDGTFQAPVGYDIPPGLNGSGVPIAFGDFNGDGNVDLAMWGGYQTVAIYLGNGDGTFQNPWYSNVPIAADQSVDASVRFAVADFNHDGNLDLAIVGLDYNAETRSVYILPGDGTGLFSNAIPVLNLGYTDSTHYQVVESLLVGDYDSDDNADLTVPLASYYTSEGGLSGSTVHVLFGNGDFSFQDTTIPDPNSAFSSVGSGDLNGDGYTDLFILGSGLQTFYGQADRTFASYTQPLPNWFYGSDLSIPYPAMADFNDDGLMDLVLEAHDYTNPGFLVFLLATSTPGQFDVQTWNLNPSAQEGYPALAVGDFNGDGAPDWATHFFWGTNFPGETQTITTGLNATANGNWSNCPYPITGRGISLCTPASSSTAPVDFNATAHSFGQLRKMEVWVDGNKLAEQHNTWGGNAFLNFDTTSLAAGSHQGTIYAADIDNTLQRYDFNFTVEPSSCGAPSSPGVNICSPTDGSTTSNNQVLVQATATIQGTLARMEIWVDGVKDYTETDSTSLAASLNLRAGSHTITVYAVNTDGTLWSQTITANVP